MLTRKEASSEIWLEPGKKKKTSTESTIEDQLKELKDLLQETN